MAIAIVGGRPQEKGVAVHRDVRGDLVIRPRRRSVGRCHAARPAQRVVGCRCVGLVGALRRLEGIGRRGDVVGNSAADLQPPRVVGHAGHQVADAQAIYVGVVNLRLHHPPQSVVVGALLAAGGVLGARLHLPRGRAVAVGISQRRRVECVAGQGHLAQPSEAVVAVARNDAVGVRHRSDQPRKRCIIADSLGLFGNVRRTDGDRFW